MDLHILAARARAVLAHVSPYSLTRICTMLRRHSACRLSVRKGRLLAVTTCCLRFTSETQI